MSRAQHVYLSCVAFLILIAAVQADVRPAHADQATLSSVLVRKDAISISGISSGACMATQFHVAYSQTVMGAGIVSGAPYWCAQSNIAVALSACMKNPSLISTPLLTSAVNYAYATNSIDNPAYLKNSRVFVFHGTQDVELVPGVGKKVKDFYRQYIPESQVHMNASVPAAHAFVTQNFGNPCGFFGEPFMNNCDYDTAGSILQWIYGPLKAPVASIGANLVSMDQSAFVPFPFNAAQISMANLGYAYIPSGCKSRDNQCRLHVALHGCLQNIDTIGFSFVSHAGYNEWAESNNIIIVYPQTIVSPTLPYNPKGCWDWWGYTGPQYASQLAPQMQVIHSMIKSFSII